MSDDKEFPKRYEKKLPTGFVESIESMDSDDVKSKIYESQCHVYEIEKAKDEDEKLTQTREMVKEMMAPYKDAQGTEAAKIKYCFFVLEGRGIDLTAVKAAKNPKP